MRGLSSRLGMALVGAGRGHEGVLGLGFGLCGRCARAVGVSFLFYAPGTHRGPQFCRPGPDCLFRDSRASSQPPKSTQSVLTQSFQVCWVFMLVFAWVPGVCAFVLHVHVGQQIKWSYFIFNVYAICVHNLLQQFVQRERRTDLFLGTYFY